MRTMLVGMLTIVLFSPVFGGCKGRTAPTAAACQTAIQHMLDLWAAADPGAQGNGEKMKGMLPGLVSICQQKYSAKKVECLTTAQSKTDADACTD